MSSKFGPHPFVFNVEDRDKFRKILLKIDNGEAVPELEAMNPTEHQSFLNYKMLMDLPSSSPRFSSVERPLTPRFAIMSNEQNIAPTSLQTNTTTRGIEDCVVPDVLPKLS